ncbi:hypothetical protein MPH_05613 [Macrophomina phaseolina MS6]|uniref:BZIP domain-containing protein n=1 Tax=Macrophomina phaseolina (strain MS6) TaxID=1126212 RepID=K2S3S2_MACPH|nr:hypothetical protein MPH_05613 [Macrophomina phaseolina MS6]
MVCGPQQIQQPNPRGFSDLENHDCVVSDIAGIAFDFALGTYSQPDLLASFSDIYHPPPPDSISDFLTNGALDATAALGIFNDLPLDQSPDAWLALDGVSSAINDSHSSDHSTDNIFAHSTMYNESFLASTLNPLITDPTLFPASAEPSSKASSARPSPYSTVESTFSNEATASASCSASSCSSSSSSSSSSGTKRKRSADETPSVDETLADKRRRNNLAAAKYRQKKVDRISELEKEVEDVSKERDELKLQLARRDAELEVLRRLLAERK